MQELFVETQQVVQEAQAIHNGRCRPMLQPLITMLGVAEGEVLDYLEQRARPTALRRVIRAMEWPAPVVLMSVGALVRQGLVRATQHELEVVLEPLPAAAQ